MLSQRIGDINIKQSQDIPTLQALIRQILLEKDQLIEQLNGQLKAMRTQLQQIIDSIETNKYLNLAQFSLQTLKTNGFICTSNQKHIIVVDVSALVNSGQVVFKMDSNLTILKQQNYDSYAKSCEQLNNNYLHLLQQLTKAQNLINQKESVHNLIVQTQKQYISIDQAQKSRQKCNQLAAQDTNSNRPKQFIDKVLQQNQLIKMELQQLKNQTQTYRNFSQKKIQLNDTPKPHFYHCQDLQAKQGINFQMINLQTLNQKLTLENASLNKIKQQLTNQNNHLSRLCKRLQFQYQKQQSLISKYGVSQSAHSYQDDQKKNQACQSKFYKQQTEGYYQNKQVKIQTIKQKHQKNQQIANVNHNLQLNLNGFNLNGVAPIDFQMISPISFPQASTNHKQKQKKQKPKRMIRLGY